MKTLSFIWTSLPWHFPPNNSLLLLLHHNFTSTIPSSHTFFFPFFFWLAFYIIFSSVFISSFISSFSIFFISSHVFFFIIHRCFFFRIAIPSFSFSQLWHLTSFPSPPPPLSVLLILILLLLFLIALISPAASLPPPSSSSYSFEMLHSFLLQCSSSTPPLHCWRVRKPDNLRSFPLKYLHRREWLGISKVERRKVKIVWKNPWALEEWEYFTVLFSAK